MLLIRRIPVRGLDAGGEAADGSGREAGTVFPPSVDARGHGSPFFIGDPECVIYLGRSGCFDSSFGLAPVTMLLRMFNVAFFSSVW